MTPNVITLGVTVVGFEAMFVSSKAHMAGVSSKEGWESSSWVIGGDSDDRDGWDVDASRMI